MFLKYDTEFDSSKHGCELISEKKNMQQIVNSSTSEGKK